MFTVRFLKWIKCLNLNLRRKSIASTRVFAGLILKIKICNNIIETSRSTCRGPIQFCVRNTIQNGYISCPTVWASSGFAEGLLSVSDNYIILKWYVSVINYFLICQFFNYAIRIRTGKCNFFAWHEVFSLSSTYCNLAWLPNAERN